MPLVRKIRSDIGSIIDHGDQVFTIILHPEKKVPPFQPGQFLHLALDEYLPSKHWPDSRAFSIASVNTSDKNEIRISYSVKGVFTARMAEELQIGKKVWIKLPYGDFVVQDEKNIVLIAGGTGITAFTAYIQSINLRSDQSVKLFYGARRESLLLYQDLIFRAKKKNPNLTLHFFLENYNKQNVVEKGIIVPSRLSMDQVLQNVNRPKDNVYFLSGPPAMIHYFSKELKNENINDSNVRIDAWE